MLAATAVKEAQCQNHSTPQNGTGLFKVALLFPVEGSSLRYIRKHSVHHAAKWFTDKLNAEGALPGYTVTYTLLDTACSHSQGVGQMIAVNRYSPNAILGPACEFNCESCSALAAKWKIPMISYACQSNHPVPNPFFTKTVTSFLETGRFIWAILNHFGWTKVALLLCRESMFDWMELTEEISRSYGKEAPQSWVVDFKHETEEQLDMHMKQSQVFVLCMYPREVTKFLKAVQKYSDGYVYITTDYLNKERFDFQGLLDITVNGHVTSDSYKEFFTRTTCQNKTCLSVEQLHKKKLTLANVKKLCGNLMEVANALCCETCRMMNTSTADFWMDICSSPSNVTSVVAEGRYNNLGYLCYREKERPWSFLQVAMMIDAFIMLIEAAKTVQRQGVFPDLNSKQASQLIAETLKSNEFQGLSGNITIMKDGTRFVNLLLHNLVNGTYHTIGRSRYGRSGDHMVTYESLSEDITWPGGSKDKPKCPESVCPTGTSESVDPLDIGVPSGTVGFLCLVGIAFFIFKKQRHRRRQIDKWMLTSAELYSAGFSDGGKASKRTLGIASKLVWKQSKKDNDIGGQIHSHESLRAYVSGRLFAKVTVLNNQVVAVKPVHKHSVEVTNDVANEVKQIRRLVHNNVNQLVGACVESGNVCLVWSYGSKGSLRDVLDNSHLKLDWTFRLSFISDIARGMAFIHASPVKIHGNLKSLNVVVDKNWCCKITDFAMPNFRANRIKENLLSKQYCYDLLWTAPELIMNDELRECGTRKGDVYSFGIIIQEIIDRSHPFGFKKSDKPRELLNRLMAGENPPFRPKVCLLNPVDGEDASVQRAVMDLMIMCWDKYPLLRLSFNIAYANLESIRNRYGTTASLADQMLNMVRKYADNLEDLVEERTVQLEEEKKKTEDLLQKMLPQSVAYELKMGNPVIPETYHSVTLFFSDILGFADITSVSTPIQVVNLLNDLYTYFDNIIDTYDAYKVETIADNYVVSSGLPVRNGSQHARVIATLALDLLCNVLSFKIRHMPNTQLMLRIGIHTGPVVAGVVGKKMPRYCLFGDTVNYTSRVESTGKALHIHVSPECKTCLEMLGGFHLRERGYVEMKGKGKILTYFLTGKENFVCRVPNLSLEIRSLVGIDVMSEIPVGLKSKQFPTRLSRAFSFL